MQNLPACPPPPPLSSPRNRKPARTKKQKRNKRTVEKNRCSRECPQSEPGAVLSDAICVTVGSWCVCPFVCAANHPPPTPPSSGLRLLEHALQHGRGVGGARLPALDGAAEVLDPAAALPDLLELPGEDLGAPLPRQARLLQTQLAHLHVVFSCCTEVKSVRQQQAEMSFQS